MVQTFSLLERYLKKKCGPSFQKQLIDFMETSNKLFDIFCHDKNRRRELQLKHPLRMSDIEFQFYEDQKGRRRGKCVQCSTVQNGAVDIHCNISNAVPVLWPQHQLIITYPNLVQIEHDKSHPQ